MQRNQRQKKKSSQSRKRHFDSTKAKDASKNQSSGTQKQHEAVKSLKGHSSDHQHKGTDTVNKVKEEPADVTKTKDHITPDHKKYSKRKVASNWDRYDHQGDAGDPHGGSGRSWESEEQLQQRLIQLLNLPVYHVAHTATVEPSSFEEHSNISNSFVSLDCESLAVALSSLPLHKRLDISKPLIELGQADIHSSGDIVAEKSLNAQNITIPSNKSSSVKEMDVQGKRAKTDNSVDLKALVSGKKPVKDFVGGGFDFQVHLPPVSTGVPTAVTHDEHIKSHTCDQGLHTDHDRDEELLDGLLEQHLTKPVSDELPKTPVEKLNVVGSSSLPPPAAGETDALDEMLDDLLA